MSRRHGHSEVIKGIDCTLCSAATNNSSMWHVTGPAPCLDLCAAGEAIRWTAQIADCIRSNQGARCIVPIQLAAMGDNGPARPIVYRFCLAEASFPRPTIVDLRMLVRGCLLDQGLYHVGSAQAAARFGYPSCGRQDLSCALRARRRPTVHRKPIGTEVDGRAFVQSSRLSLLRWRAGPWNSRRL